MEIFNNIWTALSTPNEIITNIILIPFSFIDAYICMLLFTTLLNIDASKKNKFIYISILSISAILIRFFISNPYATIINLILIPILIVIFFKVSILKAILAEIIPILFSSSCESLFSNVIFSAFNVSANTALYIPIYRISIMTIVYISIYIIYSIIKHFKFYLSIDTLNNKKNKITYIITFILGIITIGMHFYLINYYSDKTPIIITLINIISTAAFFLMTIYSLVETIKLETTTTDLEEAKLYNKTLSMLHDNIRTFKHDFHNIVQGIGGYIHTDDMEGLKKFYSGLSLDCNRSNNLTTLSPSVINNPAIYNVLASKYHKADEFGIQINLEVFIDLNTLNMKIYEFTRILGILMDNAIEATLQCDEKIINIIIRKEDKNNRQILYIENTYKDNGTTVDKLFEKGYSSKEGNTGLGLWEVRQILHKNNNLNLFTDKDKKFFKQQLEIYK